MTFRSRKLLDLAHKLNTCPLCGQYIPHGLEPAHSDSQKHGKGMGHKAADHFHAAICHDCHETLPRMPRAERELTWQRAYEATMTTYWERGWLQVQHNAA